jgi:hypothetical protein
MLEKNPHPNVNGDFSWPDKLQQVPGWTRIPWGRVFWISNKTKFVVDLWRE